MLGMKASGQGCPLSALAMKVDYVYLVIENRQQYRGAPPLQYSLDYLGFPESQAAMIRGSEPCALVHERIERHHLHMAQDGQLDPLPVL